MLYFSYLLNAYAPERDEPHQLILQRVHGTVVVRSACRACDAAGAMAFLPLLDLKYMFKVLCTQRLTRPGVSRSIQNYSYVVREDVEVVFRLRSLTLRHCLRTGDLTLSDRRGRLVYLGSLHGVGLCALALLLRVLYGHFHEPATLCFSHRAHRNKRDHGGALLVRKRPAAARLETLLFLRNLRVPLPPADTHCPH